MDWSASLKYALSLITSKKLAAVITTAWVFFHIAAAYFPQFAYLRTNGDNDFHLADTIGFLALASLTVSGALRLFSHVSSRMKHVRTHRAVKKAVERILQSRCDEQYIILVHLYHFPDSPFNPMKPIVKHLFAKRLITPTSDVGTPQLRGRYTLPFDLTLEVREYMHAHRDNLPKAQAFLRYTPFATANPIFDEIFKA